MDWGNTFSGVSHPPQNGGSEGNTQYGQQSTGGETEGNVGVNGIGHGLIVLCAEVPGDDHAGAHGNAVKKADHHKNQAGGGADGSQGGISEKLSHNPGIKGIIKLLKQIPQQYGNREKQHLFPNGTIRHGTGLHMAISSFSILSSLLYPT